MHLCIHTFLYKSYGLIIELNIRRLMNFIAYSGGGCFLCRKYVNPILNKNKELTLTNI